MLFPATCETGVEQERTADPSTCTVHAPHNPAPQPYLVPVSSRLSRKTHSSGVSGATFTFRSLPLTRRVSSAIGDPLEGNMVAEIQRGGKRWPSSCVGPALRAGQAA